MYHYLISWVDTATAFAGNGTFNVPEPITDMNHIHEIAQKLIDTTGMTSPVIMGFSLFGGPR